jgi:hypothetical protein
MTNAELMQLSTEELLDLNKRVVMIVKLKKQNDAVLNKHTLKVGMDVKYTSNAKNMSHDKFTIIKINRTKAHCKCHVTGTLWGISLANLEPLVAKKV